MFNIIINIIDVIIVIIINIINIIINKIEKQNYSYWKKTIYFIWRVKLKIVVVVIVVVTWVYLGVEGDVIPKC